MAFAAGVAVVGSLWGWALNWGGGEFNINVNRYNNINRNNIRGGRASTLPATPIAGATTPPIAGLHLSRRGHAAAISRPAWHALNQFAGFSRLFRSGRHDAGAGRRCESRPRLSRPGVPRPGLSRPRLAAGWREFRGSGPVVASGVGTGAGKTTPSAISGAGVDDQPAGQPRRGQPAAMQRWGGSTRGARGGSSDPDIHWSAALWGWSRPLRP